MLRLLFLLVSALGGRVGFGLRPPLLSLRLENEWRAVREISRGHEYWLYPRPEIRTASWCRSCDGGNVVQLSIRFWREDDLESTRSALRREGWCSEQQPCRVAPFQATRVVLRDPGRSWEPVRRSVALAGILPNVVDFTVRPVSDENFRNDSAVPLQRLTSLEIDIILTNDFPPADAKSKQLVVTSVDLEVALRLLPAKQFKVIDRSSLGKLTRVLLKMKTRHLGGAAVLRPALRAELQQQLTTSSVEYRDELKALLPPGYRAQRGDVLFFLKQLGASEQVAISLDENANSGSVTVGVRLQRAFTDKAAISENRPAAKPDALQIALLRKQVEKLASLAKAEHILDPAVMDLQAIDDCIEVQRRKLKGGLFYLRPLRRAVRCTADGFLVVLHRSKDTTNFNVTFREYEEGIGDVKTDGYFIGLKALSQITLADDSCMVLNLVPWRLNVTSRTAKYDSFIVSDNKENYKLKYSNFSGTTLNDVLSFSRGQMFTTKDRDNDPFVGNCAHQFSSGNWYFSCQQSNVFGPYRPNSYNGMCSTGIAKSQGTMCSPLTAVQMLLRKKIHARKASKIVYSIIASPFNCTSSLELFNVTEGGLYSITLGGAPGGLSPTAGARPGGRGAKMTGVFHLESGSVLAFSAGCRGKSGDRAGDGGSASWAVLRPEGVLLGVAGGGGGASGYVDPKTNENFTPLGGMHGRATPEGGDAWWEPRSTRTYDAKSILKPTTNRGNSWRELREKFLNAISGDVASGLGAHSWGGGGGGGGFLGGFDGPSSDMYHGGGGGGSLCNATEAKFCSLETGGNTRPTGYVVLEKLGCF